MIIAHLADLHLGYRAYFRTDPETGLNQREQDVLNAFDYAVARLVEIQPNLILIAGDVFHTARPSNAAIKHALSSFRFLREHVPDAPIVIISGNHDLPKSADTVCVLRVLEEIPGVIVIERKAQRFVAEGVIVDCVPEVALHGGEVPKFDPAPSGAVRILLLHGSVSGSQLDHLNLIASQDHNSIKVGELGVDNYDYVALGHYHIQTAVRPFDHVRYAGAIERTTNNIWEETADKGFIVVDTDRLEFGGDEAVRFERVPTRAMCDLYPLDATGFTAGEMMERLAAAVEVNQIEGALVRQVVVNCPREVARELDHEQIRAWKADALHYQLDIRSSNLVLPTIGHAPRYTLEDEWSTFSALYKPKLPDIPQDKLTALGLHYLGRVSEAQQ